MRRGLKRSAANRSGRAVGLPRARPPMRRGLKRLVTPKAPVNGSGAARAAPYEKGTETNTYSAAAGKAAGPRARPPMRRGLKHRYRVTHQKQIVVAARAAPYEKGTETCTLWGLVVSFRRRARGPL